MDASISEILRLKHENSVKPDKSKLLYVHSDVINLWQSWEVLDVRDNLLYHKSFSKVGDPIMQLVAPEQIRAKIFENLHCQRYAGHFGRDRTIDAIKHMLY